MDMIIWILIGILALAFGMDIYYMLYGINLERVITKEDEDDMDYVELNEELIPYNEDDQE